MSGCRIGNSSLSVAGGLFLSQFRSLFWPGGGVAVLAHVVFTQQLPEALGRRGSQSGKCANAIFDKHGGYFIAQSVDAG